MRRPKTSFQRCCGKTGVVKDAGDQHNCPPQVGFSGVLFSWIVVAAVELPSFCVFGSACFATRDMRGVRFNIAPFALAAAIQLFLPRASLLGHAAGIVVGYPLAWRLLDSLTPPTIGTILAIIDSMLLDGGTFQQALRPCSCASAMLQAASGLHLWHGGFALSLVIPVEAAALTTIACASRASVSTTALFVVVMHALSMATLAGSLTSDPQLSIIAATSLLTHLLAAALLAVDLRHYLATADNLGPLTAFVATALLGTENRPIGPCQIRPFSGDGRVLSGMASHQLDS